MGSPQFEARLDALTATTLVPGNHVRLLVDAEALQERTVLSQEARPGEPFFVESFILRDDEVGRRTSEDWAALVTRGNPVHFTYDAKGSEATSPELFDELRARGINVGAMPVWPRINNRWHKKSHTLGQRITIVGGTNFGDEFFRPPRGSPDRARRTELGLLPKHDVDLRIEGPLVPYVLRSFLETARCAQGMRPILYAPSRMEPPPFFRDEQAVAARFVSHLPGHNTGGRALALILTCLASAERSVTIVNPFITPPPGLMDALVLTAARGVRVRIMTTARDAHDHGFAHDAACFHYTRLVQAGIELYECDPMVHAKTVTIDGHYNVVGSVNFNVRSFARDGEGMVAFSHPVTAARLEQTFEELTGEATRIGIQELRNTPTRQLLRQLWWGKTGPKTVL